MFGRDKNRNEKKRELSVNFRKSRDDIPQPKGKFRNLFEEKGMIPESLKSKADAGQKPDAPKSE